jgi:glycosyltransferase involved in cell wall biosynthesis
MSAPGRKLRILHTEASMGWGGQEIRILSEARVFRAHGHDVCIAANEGSEIAANAGRYDVPVTILPLAQRNLRSVLAAGRFIASWRPDVVNTHSSVDSWLVALARLGLRPRPRVVRTRHLSARVPRNPASRWVYNRGADFVITTGEAIVEALAADGFVPRSRLASVPTGIDADVFRPGSRHEARLLLGLPAGKILFGIVATLRSWKGHADLLDALARTGDPRLHLVIVGDGPRQQAIEQQIADLGLADRVTLTGRKTDTADYFRAFDVFVLPSYANEGVPQALLQAMASGLPAISCPIGGIPECTQRLPSVTLVPPRDVDALAQAMIRVANEPPGEEALAAARQRVIDGYSLEAMYRSALRYFSG